MTPQEIQQLKEQVAMLLKWKSDKEHQQFTYPMDQNSADIIVKNLVVANGAVAQPTGLLGSPTALQIEVDGGKKYWILASPTP